MLHRRGKTSVECAVGAMRKRNSREWNTHHTALWRDTGRDASFGLGADKLSTGKIHREENGEQNSGSFIGRGGKMAGVVAVAPVSLFMESWPHSQCKFEELLPGGYDVPYLSISVVIFITHIQQH